MISRRDMLKWSALTPVPAFAGMAPLSIIQVPEGLDGFVIDRRHAGSGLASPFGARVFKIDGDVTALWYETLDPLWRKPGFVLGGITGADALFVLENLAWDRGRRVVSRKLQDASAGKDGKVISWVIAPHHPSVKA
ncbi:hypothetical protein FHS61_001455 [Altererythrobacter atlanticus]|uniref:Uncharacterized protein n=1 Tax=Croceibacterium atlanticum TaxID=1267766 RepID=A0A0F7KY15_9SPHN|nr:hypothetical protein [Croceibacterium atlanticum]AKH44136.1 hypothetical protein WYH_03117 [Croceibacterium atlanticum]MBB5732446.1 hypothetical protein [Croceibacterium atlanticum]